jgi:hypothetical protein
MENILPILIADDPQALFELCGVSLLERFTPHFAATWVSPCVCFVDDS